MNNPETIIRGIMQEAAKDAITRLAAKHIGKKNPTVGQVEAHFVHDEKAAKQIEKLAGTLEEESKELREACWSGYVAKGTKKKGGRTVPNCVPIEEAKSEAWQRKEGKDPEGGLNAKGVASYRRANPGSKLQTAVTTEPSKLAPGSKKLTSAKTARDPDSRINKSLRKWNCE